MGQLFPHSAKFTDEGFYLPGLDGRYSRIGAYAAACSISVFSALGTYRLAPVGRKMKSQAAMEQWFAFNYRCLITQNVFHFKHFFIFWSILPTTSVHPIRQPVNVGVTTLRYPLYGTIKKSIFLSCAHRSNMLPVAIIHSNNTQNLLFFSEACDSGPFKQTGHCRRVGWYASWRTQEIFYARRRENWR
jgi:hypothetical protein